MKFLKHSIYLVSAFPWISAVCFPTVKIQKWNLLCSNQVQVHLNIWKCSTCSVVPTWQTFHARFKTQPAVTVQSMDSHINPISGKHILYYLLLLPSIIANMQVMLLWAFNGDLLNENVSICQGIWPIFPDYAQHSEGFGPIPMSISIITTMAVFFCGCLFLNSQYLYKAGNF